MATHADAVPLRRKVVRWNLFCNTADGAFAVLAFSLAHGTFVVAPFLRAIGASDFIIGLITGLVPLGTFLLPVLATGYIQSLPRKKPLVLKLGIFQRMHFPAVAVMALLMLPAHPIAFLWLFALTSFITNAAGQGGLPAWLDMIAKTTPRDKRGLLFSMRNTLGVLPTFFAAGLIAWVLNNPSLPFPQNYSVIFGAAGLSFIISLLIIIGVRERGGKTKTGRSNPLQMLRDVPRVLRRDGEFGRYVASVGLNGIAMGMIGAFMALTAEDRFHVSAAEVTGQYLAVTAACSIVGNLVFGRIGDRWGHRFNMVIRGPLFIVGCVIALLAQNPFQFGLAFIPITLSGAVAGISQMTMAMEFSSERNRPRYTAIQSMLSTPLMMLGPLLGGFLRDYTSLSMSFFVAIALTAVSTYLQLTVRDPRQRAVSRRLAAAERAHHQHKDVEAV